MEITPGTAAASKALILDANKDIGTIRNLTIDGVFTDGNYTGIQIWKCYWIRNNNMVEI